MLQSLAALAVLLAVVLAGRRLWRSRPPARAHAAAAGGVLELRPPRRIGVLLGLGALLPAVIFAAVDVRAWAANAAGPAGLAAGALAALLALGVAVHQLLSAFLARVIVHDTGIERVGVATRRRVAWRSIASVAYNPVNRWFVLTTSDGGHLWLSEDLRGISELAAIALRRLPAAALRDAVAREALADLAEEALDPAPGTPGAA
jgi:hypothetical protein